MNREYIAEILALSDSGHGIMEAWDIPEGQAFTMALLGHHKLQGRGDHGSTEYTASYCPFEL
jgi:hypothetical protein